MITVIYYYSKDNRYEAYIRHGINGQWLRISEWEATKEIKKGKWETTKTEEGIKYKKIFTRAENILSLI